MRLQCTGLLSAGSPSLPRIVVLAWRPRVGGTGDSGNGVEGNDARGRQREPSVRRRRRPAGRPPPFQCPTDRPPTTTRSVQYRRVTLSHRFVVLCCRVSSVFGIFSLDEFSFPLFSPPFPRLIYGGFFSANPIPPIVVHRSW